MPFGLTKKEIAVVHSVFRKFRDIKRVIVFGSRAMGNFKKGSDIDLAITGDVTPERITEISMVLNEETTLPYFFDLIDYEKTTNPELKQHMDRHGVVFYERE